MKQLTKLNIFQLEKFKNHPYSVKHDESFFELVESIKENGLINPIVVRPIADKTFEIVSGHRRKEAIEYLGIFEIDAYIEELNDYEATILMVDSNIQREMVLPSEKAFAYKMKLEAQKVLGVPSGHRAREIVSKGVKESQTSIQRYIRLTYLIEEPLKLIDETFIERHRLITLGIRSGVELSYLTIEEQKLVYEMMLYDEMTPDLSQCKRIRELSKKKKLDGYALEEIFHELKGCQQNRIYFNKSKIISQLPVELAKRDKRYIEKYIIEAIRFYKANKND